MSALATGASWTIAPRRHRRPEDIEQLLQWAYAAQRVDLMLGHGLTDQERHIDASECSGGNWNDMLALERIGLLGCRIDVGGIVTSAPVHPDAATIHNAVMRLNRPLGLLVMQHARDRTRPCSGIGVKPAFRYPRGRKGGPLVIYDPSDVGRHYGHCPIVWTIDLAEIEARRGVYAVWRRALKAIGIELLRSGELINVTPTGPAAPDLSKRA